MRKNHLFGILYGLLLTSFTLYVTLDTFVITRVYTEVSAISAESLGSGAEVTTTAIDGQDSENENTETAAQNETSQEETVSAQSEESQEKAAASTETETSETSHRPGKGRKSSSGSSGRPSGGSGRPSGGSGRPSGRRSSDGDSTTDNTSSATTEASAGPSAKGSADASTSNAAGTTNASTSNAAGTTNASANSSASAAGSSDTSTITSASAAGSSDTSASAASAPISTDTAYQDENISISLTEYRANDTTIYVADVTVSSADYLKTALAQNAYGRNVTQKTSEMAASNNAILAINGDYYGSQSSGYVLRNGVLYRSTAEKNQEDLVIYADGSFAVINESEVTAEELLANGAVQILSFGPALVTDGTVSVTAGEEVGKAMASNPRTAIGIIDENHYVFVVSDGRTSESEGLSLSELASFMQGLGVKTAYNLDGGGSSTMYFNGSIVNNPTTNGNSIKERSVSDIVYIGY